LERKKGFHGIRLFQLRIFYGVKAIIDSIIIIQAFFVFGPDLSLTQSPVFSILMAAERAFVLFSSAHRLTDSKPQEKIAMKGIKKLVFLVVFIVFLFPKASVAENVNLELYANSDDIKFQIGWEFAAFNSYPELGFGIDYGDDYLIGNLRFAIRDEVFTPGLTLGLGLQGYFGEVEIRNRDFDLQALSRKAPPPVEI